MMKITIDNQTFTIDEELTLLAAAKECNVEIPSLCGNNINGEKMPCDLCVVDIEGQGIQRACETKAVEGMKVITSSEALVTRRQSALNKILSDH